MASAVIKQCLECCYRTASDTCKPSPEVQAVVNLPKPPVASSFKKFDFVQKTTTPYPVHPGLQTSSNVVRVQPRREQKSLIKPGLPLCSSDSTAECKEPAADRQFTQNIMRAELHTTARSSDDPDQMAAAKWCDDDVVYPFVQFSVFHDIQQQTLRLHIVRACNLERKKGNKQCNPFLSCFLNPNREEVFETQVARLAMPSSDDSTSSCCVFKFNETFVFKRITSSEIPHQTLILKVYHRDLLSRSEQIGFIALPLGRVELYGEEMLMRMEDHSQQPKVRKFPT